MRLKKFRVTNYRSIRDSGWCEVDSQKTIFVGPNEAGKSALLTALQQINPPVGALGFKPLRDYPRALYNDITVGKVDPKQSRVVEAHFAFEPTDLAKVPGAFKGGTFCFARNLDGGACHWLEGVPRPTYSDLARDYSRLAAHLDSQSESEEHSAQLKSIVADLNTNAPIGDAEATILLAWLTGALPIVDENNEKEEARHARLCKQLEDVRTRSEALQLLAEMLPVFVLFSNYHRVRPRIHLQHLAARVKSGVMDDELYDYGNQCLLNLLGFEASELSRLGNAPAPAQNNAVALQQYQDQLDERTYQLNAASVRLTSEISGAWNPDKRKGEADRLRIIADGQYLKVVVEDEVGVEVELDQRSEGFQWLVSFFVVFFAEATGKHENAILLLDEPGMSLHALKQREFRRTVSRLASQNQTIYTTHSPFLVGPDELDRVRVVEMTDRASGTKVHTTLTAGDSAALLPLQEALGYDMAQSLFSQQRNLICEGLTDYWYVDATAALLSDMGLAELDRRIALVPAHGAGKVTYFATILHANNLKVAALLDSDVAGDTAANQDTLVHTLKNKGILRTKDFYAGAVSAPEIEDLLRLTLVGVAAAEFGVDVTAQASNQPSRSIIGLLQSEIPKLTKYKLAKAYLQWTRTNDANDLQAVEVQSWIELISAANKALK